MLISSEIAKSGKLRSPLSAFIRWKVSTLYGMKHGKLSLFMSQMLESFHFPCFKCYKVFTLHVSNAGKFPLSMFQMPESFHFPCFKCRKVSTFCFMKQGNLLMFCVMKDGKLALSMFHNMKKDLDCKKWKIFILINLGPMGYLFLSLKISCHCPIK